MLMVFFRVLYFGLENVIGVRVEYLGTLKFMRDRKAARECIALDYSETV